MKLTKVGKTRIAVKSKVEIGDYGRGILYPAPKEEKIKRNFYLENYMNDICHNIRNINKKNKLQEVRNFLENYSGYSYDGNRNNISDVKINPIGKNGEDILGTHIYGRMNESVYRGREKYEVINLLLRSICSGNNFGSEISTISDEQIKVLVDICDNNKFIYQRYVDENGVKEYTDKQIENRVNHANKLYNLFFVADKNDKLEGYFGEICNIFKSIEYKLDENDNIYNVNELIEALETYVENNESLLKYSYNSNNKSVKQMMKLHVDERMAEKWQEYREEAVEILLCICDGENFINNIIKLLEDKANELSVFWKWCREDVCNDIYVNNTYELEKEFTNMIKGLVSKCDKQAYWDDDKVKIEKGISSQIEYLKNYDLKSFEKYPYANDDRMKALIVRMRKSIKRGTNAEVAVKLLQGIASKSLKEVIDDMKIDELTRFVNSVNKDYYRINTVKSVKNINVKIQVEEENKDDCNKENKLRLSNSAKSQVLTDTLREYASSKQASDKVLLDIKKILYKYFWGEKGYNQYAGQIDDKNIFLEKNMWNFPKRNVYLDNEWEVNKESDKSGARMSIEEAFYNIKNEKGAIIKIEKECVNQNALKERIRYVNYGRYCQMRYKKDDNGDETIKPFEAYWIKFIKEYVEKEYVDKAHSQNGRKIKRILTKEDCLTSNILYNCWKDIIRYICGKYMDIGKIVYHIAMPESTPEDGERIYGRVMKAYENGISSFTYEAISATDNLERSIDNMVIAAVNNFTRSVFEDRIDDVLTLENSEVNKATKRDQYVTQLLRYYGGESSFVDKSLATEGDFVKEIISHFNFIRNSNYHYAPGKNNKLKTEYAQKLWKNDLEAYKRQVRKKYYSNNVSWFYDMDNIKELVTDLYRNTDISEAQIPAFQNVWKKIDLPQDILKSTGESEKFFMFENVEKTDKEKEDNLKIFEGALYFLLKEIYYKDFIKNNSAKAYFVEAVMTCGSGRNDKKSKLAEGSFRAYIRPLQYMKGMTLGKMCQTILDEYNHQNAKEEGKYDHFKMLLPIYMKLAFKKYLEENEKYSWIRIAKKREVPAEQLETYLESVEISVPFSDKFTDTGVNGIDDDEFAWYTFAHFMHPRQLNELIGEFKNFIQFRQNIKDRMGYAGQEIEQLVEPKKDIEKAYKVLKVLDFVKGVSGIITNKFADYYKISAPKEEEAENLARNAYADYLNTYIDFGEELEQNTRVSSFEKLKYFCMEALEGTKIDIYADEINPKVLRNVELARMYAGGEMPLKGYDRVKLDEIRKYYENKQVVEKITANGRWRTEEQQIKVTDLQHIKNRITLNEVTDIYQIVNELLGKLVSLAYLRERDQMYLLLGFYYMLLESEYSWEGEKEFNKLDEYQISAGLVLHQIVGVFDYGTKLIYYSSGDEKWSLMGHCQIANKLNTFYGNHKDSVDCAIRLFQNDKEHETTILNLRKYADHSKYYVEDELSIVDVYSDFYMKFFGYSKKLRKSVLKNFENILEHYHIDAKFEFVSTSDAGDNESDTSYVISIKEMTSKNNTYKLKVKSEEGKGYKPRTKSYIEREIKLPARSEDYIKRLRNVLIYNCVK